MFVDCEECIRHIDLQSILLQELARMRKKGERRCNDNIPAFITFVNLLLSREIFSNEKTVNTITSPKPVNANILSHITHQNSKQAS